jgi:hypothetical protein
VSFVKVVVRGVLGYGTPLRFHDAEYVAGPAPPLDGVVITHVRAVIGAGISGEMLTTGWVSGPPSGVGTTSPHAVAANSTTIHRERMRHRNMAGRRHCRGGGELVCAAAQGLDGPS